MKLKQNYLAQYYPVDIKKDSADQAAQTGLGCRKNFHRIVQCGIDAGKRLEKHEAHNNEDGFKSPRLKEIGETGRLGQFDFQPRLHLSHFRTDVVLGSSEPFERLASYIWRT